MPDDRLLADAAPDEAPLAPAPKKISMLKMTFFAVLAALAVFLVWAFYPVSAPEKALRGCLPEVCVATVEMHAPASLNSGLLQRDFGARLQKLPAYPLLARLFMERGVDLESAGPDIGRQMRALDSAVCGLRNCVALAFGATLDAEPQIAMLFSVDNLGALLLHGYCLFAPRADEGRCRLIHIPESLTNGEKVPDFYLAPVPGTRLFRVATSPELLRQYRMDAPAAAPSLYPEGRQNAVEMCVQLDAVGGGLSHAAGPLAAPARAGAKTRANAKTPPMKMPMKTALPAGGLNFDLSLAGHAYFWWEFERFGGETRLRLRDAAPAPKTPLQLYAQDVAMPGLSASLALPPENLDPQALLGILEMLPVAEWLPLAEMRRAAPALRGLTAHARGSFCLRLFPERGRPEAAAYWTVDHPEKARAAAARAIKQLLEGLAPAPSDEGGILGVLAPAATALLQVKEEPGQLRVSAPMLPPLIVAFAGSPGNAHAIMGSAALLPPPPRLRPCPPQTQAAARLEWRYAEELATGLGKAARGALGTAKSLAGLLGALDAAAMADADRALDDLCAILASLNDLTVEFRSQNDAAHGGAETVISYEGSLRME